MNRESRANAVFSPSGVDFEAFPPTVKRKYFSTLERLRYAQGQQPQESATMSATTAMNIFRPKSAGIPKQRSSHPRRPSFFQIRSPRHAKDVPESPSLPVRRVSREDAAWYDNLPEKIKRTHFTFEERNAYSHGQRGAAPDHTDENTFYRAGGRFGNKSLPSLSSCSEVGSARDEALKTPLDARDPIFDTLRTLDIDNTLDLGLAYYHDTNEETTSSDKTSSHHHHLSTQSRVFSLTVPIPQTPLDRGRPSVDTVSISHAIDHPTRSRSTSGQSSVGSSLSRPTTPRRPSLLERRSIKRSPSYSSIPPVPPVDLEATHVSDPTTRLKLKLYLGSAAKFDEAVEFGFPALSTTYPSRPDTAPSRPSTSSRRTHHRRSLSASAASRSVRRSLSASRSTNRGSVAIGTTFFYDDYDSEDDESTFIGFDCQTTQYPQTPSLEIGSITNTSAAEDAIGSTEAPAELPAEVPASFLADASVSSYSSKDYPQQTMAHRSLMPAPLAVTQIPLQQTRLSRSISLKPRLKTDSKNLHCTALPHVPQSAKDFTDWSRHELKSPQKQLKPWDEIENISGERDMTLRLTLTRKDLRADESEIYPNGGIGSWDNQQPHHRLSNDEVDVPTPGRWRFWAKRK